MAVPGTQGHCFTALLRVYMQDPKGGEDVVLRIHLAWWHYLQVVGPLKKTLISGKRGNSHRLQEGVTQGWQMLGKEAERKAEEGEKRGKRAEQFSD